MAVKVEVFLMFQGNSAWETVHVCVPVVSDPVTPMDGGLWSTRLLCLWDLQARILEWVAMPSSKGSS